MGLMVSRCVADVILLGEGLPMGLLSLLVWNGVLAGGPDVAARGLTITHGSLVSCGGLLPKEWGVMVSCVGLLTKGWV